MLIVRQEQIRHFIAKDDSEVIKRIGQAIRASDSKNLGIFDNKKLEAMVEIGIERAKSHGLELAEDLAAFVALMFEVAPNFDEEEEIKAALEDTNLVPSDRLAQLWERTSDEAWEGAEKSFQAEVWFSE